MASCPSCRTFEVLVFDNSGGKLYATEFHNEKSAIDFAEALKKTIPSRHTIKVLDVDTEEFIYSVRGERE